MARCRHVDLSPRLLPVDLESQLVPGTFGHAVHHLVDDLDLSAFNAHYRNDDNGAPAHSPNMLLKVVLLAYSQGLVSSRRIERACRDNFLFIALSADAKYFTTTADCIRRSRDAINPGQVCAGSGGRWVRRCGRRRVRPRHRRSRARRRLRRRFGPGCRPDRSAHCAI